MKIGILQTGLVPDNLAEAHGQYPDIFEKFLEAYGFEFAAFSVVTGEFPKDIYDCDGWLITGSRHAAYEDHPWIAPLEDFIRDAYAAEIPLVGVCFGHQVMAQALGGKVEKFGGQWGVGNMEYVHNDGSRSTLLAMHQDQVVTKPPEATVTATSDFCQFAGLSYRGKAISIQPHPEFTPEFVQALINERMGTVIPEDQARPALETLDMDNDSKKFAAEIAEFFKQSIGEKAA
ncbi:MAG: type 1 glutamine amidotransferase [Pseudomonadota bacterium]